jgi:hypothetical protein
MRIAHLHCLTSNDIKESTIRNRSPNERLLRYRVCLDTVYSCSLGLQEGPRLQVRVIDGAKEFPDELQLK